MRRHAAAFLMCLAVAGCSGSDPSTVETATGATTTVAAPAPAPPPSVAPAEPISPGPPKKGMSNPASPPRTIIVGGTDAADTADAVPGPAPAPAPTTTTTPQPGVGAVGSAAGRFLRPEPARRLVVQVRSAPGAEPRQATLDHLAKVLRSVSGKPVSILGGRGVEPGDGTWTAADLRAAADEDRPAAAADAAVIRFLFVGGKSSDGETIVGLAVSADVAAVFSEQVAGAAAEDAVTIHELGHLLGLVDLALRTGRADPEHPGHSSNRRSVMYWAVESTFLEDLLAGGPPREFDQADLADLETIRRGG